MLSPLETLGRYAPHDFTLHGLLRSRAAAGAERLFLRDGARDWTYGRFRDDVAAAAALLSGEGVRAGDRVAVLAPTTAELVISLFAITRLGAVFVPVNPELRVNEAATVLARSRPRLVLHATSLHALTAEAAGASGVKLIALETALGDLAGASRLPESHPGPAADDTCLVFFTSGTTGVPKGVMHAHRNFVVAGEGFVERQWLQSDDRMLCILPMFHVNALFYSLGGALAAGAALILGGKFSASRFWRIVADNRATQVNMLGSIGKILALRPRDEFVPGHVLDRVYCVPMPADVQKVFREEFGVRWIAEGYGMSEIPGIFAQPYGVAPQPGTMGRVCRHPDGRALGDVRIVDEEGRDVPVGEPGMLLVRTELAMLGYFEAPDLTRAAMRDGYFVTGDRVREASPGVYAFVARDKDIIRRRGENISAVEIDQAALSCPGVGEAAAVPVPSALGEDEILLAVVPRAGAEATLTSEAVHAHLRARLTAVKVPRYVAVVSSVPYGPTQRVLRFQLAQDEALRRAARDFGG